MIKSIEIKNIATFDKKGATLNDLKKVNLLFGSNGSGKTTISRLINDESISNSSVLNWSNNNKYEALVYNSDFVNETINNSEYLNGIYTLGKNSKEIDQQISQITKDITTLKDDIEKKKESLKPKRIEIDILTEDSKNSIWDIKPKKGELFYKCFDGFHNDKKKLLDEFQKYINELNIESLENLTERYNDLYNDKLEKLELIQFDELYKLNDEIDSHILSETITGNKDAVFSKIIKTLENSDWVKLGIQHLEHSEENICPFCQTEIDKKEVLDNIREVFNVEYKTKIIEINRIREIIANQLSLLLEFKTYIVKLNNKFIDKTLLNERFNSIKAKVEINLKVIDNKLREPSNNYELVNINDVVKNLVEFLNDINLKTKNYNNVVDKKDFYKLAFNKVVFIYKVNKVKSVLVSNNALIKDYEKSIIGISNSISLKTTNLYDLEMKRSNLYKELTSIE